MDQFVAMKTFVRIVETGSLTAAANALGTSQPTVVRSLAALEHHLGVSLLKRTTRRIHLTEEGTNYLEHCRNILAAVTESEKRIGTLNGDLAGKLTITAPVAFGQKHVAPVLSAFLEEHPRMSAELFLLDRVVNLVEEGVDAGIRIAALKDSSLMAMSVGQVRRVVCASEQYLRRHGTPQVPNDLRKHRCIRHTGLSPRSEWRFQVAGRNVTVPVTSVFTCNDINSAVDACVNGLGVGQFLSYMVAPIRKDGRLRYLLEKFEPRVVPVQVVYPSSKHISGKVRAFADTCAAKFRHTKFD